MADQEYYKRVVEAILRGRVVPFLGAGINLCDRPEGVTWDSSENRFLPSGKELAEFLAGQFRYPGWQSVSGPECQRLELDLARVSQYGDTILGTGKLYEELRSVFTRQYSVTSAHGFLASLPFPFPKARRAEEHYPLIVTTNYDDLMEQALQNATPPQDFDLLFYDPDADPRGKFWHKPPHGELVAIEKPNEYAHPFFQNRPVLLKIHGTIDRTDEEREGFVITEDHYIEYLADEPLEKLLPPALLEKLRRNHLLFLGYSLRDWNFRVFLRRIKRKPKESFKSWAVLLNADEAENQFWSKNGVDILNVRLGEYITALRLELEVQWPAAAVQGATGAHNNA